MKAKIIARVSTEEQREAGNSLPAQITRMEAYCKRYDFTVIDSFSFDESAYKVIVSYITVLRYLRCFQARFKR